MRFNRATDSPNGFSVAKFRGFMADTSLTDLTVLIIEDNEHAPGPLMHMVRDFGVRSVVTADGCDDGITVVRDKPVDMIISDCGTGPLNGLEFARRLRRGEEGPHRAIPIIMLAAPEEQARDGIVRPDANADVKRRSRRLEIASLLRICLGFEGV